MFLHSILASRLDELYDSSQIGNFDLCTGDRVNGLCS